MRSPSGLSEENCNGSDGGVCCSAGKEKMAAEATEVRRKFRREEVGRLIGYEDGMKARGVSSGRGKAKQKSGKAKWSRRCCAVEWRMC